MDGMDVERSFCELFDGNRRAIGLENGGSEKPAGAWDNWSWEDRLHAHLDGGDPIGVYPMAQEMLSGGGFSGLPGGWFVRWGCVDIDVQSSTKPSGDVVTEEDGHVMALNIKTALRLEGITAWIEVTRSRGRHVWVFAKDWVAARTMRRALIMACRLAGASEREVNPKQEKLAHGQLGNYVRLPYPGKDVPPSLEPAIRYTRVVLDTATPGHTYKYTLDDFVELATLARTETAALEALASLYEEPPPPARVHREDLPKVDRELTKRLGGLAWTIFCNGPLDGRDRSGTLMRLAHLCREDKLTPEEALSLVVDADLRWGKFSHRADGDKRMLSMVERAYAGWEKG